MKRITLVLVILILAVPLAVSAQGDDGDTRPFNNGRVSLEYPDGWRIADPGDGLIHIWNFLSEETPPSDADLANLPPDSVAVRLNPYSHAPRDLLSADTDFVLGFEVGVYTAITLTKIHLARWGSEIQLGRVRGPGDYCGGRYAQTTYWYEDFAISIMVASSGWELDTPYMLVMFAPGESALTQARRPVCAMLESLTVVE